MTLKAIVAALGGELYQGGMRASVPAPGHNAFDRSISLRLSGDRVLVHSFGGADWGAARADLEMRGLIDHRGRITGSTGQARNSPSLPPSARRAVAAAVWDAGQSLNESTPAARYLSRRAVPLYAENLRYHPRMPVSVYRPGLFSRAALLARISDHHDQLTAVEVTYLDPNGRPAAGLHLGRKTVGQVPAGAAVRLAPAARRMVVGEGVCTVLSAMQRSGLGGWALRSASNLAVWSPPAVVERVLIAADRGQAGQDAAARLADRLARMGRRARVVLPPLPHDDWNEAAMAEARAAGIAGRMEGGGMGVP